MVPLFLDLPIPGQDGTVFTTEEMQTTALIHGYVLSL